MIRVPSAAACRARCHCTAPGLNISLHLQRETFSIHQPTHQPAKTKQQQQQQRGALWRELHSWCPPAWSTQILPFYFVTLYIQRRRIYYTRDIRARERKSWRHLYGLQGDTKSFAESFNSPATGEEEEEEGAHTISNWIQISWQRTTSWINVTPMEIGFFFLFLKWFGTKTDLRLELLMRCRVWAQIKSKLIWG